MQPSGVSVTSPVTAKAAVCPDRVLTLVAAAQDMKAVDLAVLDLRALTSFTDFFLVCSGTSDRHVRAIADEIHKQLKTAGELPVSYEGYDAGQWILLDYGDVVAHIFLQDAREFYQIERLWADAPRCELP